MAGIGVEEVKTINITTTDRKKIKAGDTIVICIKGQDILCKFVELDKNSYFVTKPLVAGQEPSSTGYLLLTFATRLRPSTLRSIRWQRKQGQTQQITLTRMHWHRRRSKKRRTITMAKKNEIAVKAADFNLITLTGDLAEAVAEEMDGLGTIPFDRVKFPPEAGSRLSFPERRRTRRRAPRSWSALFWTITPSTPTGQINLQEATNSRTAAALTGSRA